MGKKCDKTSHTHIVKLGTLVNLYFCLNNDKKKFASLGFRQILLFRTVNQICAYPPVLRMDCEDCEGIITVFTVAISQHVC